MKASDAEERSTPHLSNLHLVGKYTTSQAALVGNFASRGIKRASGMYLFVEGDRPRPFIVISGWVSLQRMLADGRRQIFAIALPGDLIGMPVHLPVYFEAVCLTASVLADASSVTSDAFFSEHPHSHLQRAVVEAEALKQFITLNHMMRLGRLSSFERVGHFILETEFRLSVVGLAPESGFTIPITQETLADYLGLSVVHINRTLQHLKREKLIERDGMTVTIISRDALAQTCHFSLPAFRDSQPSD